MTWKSHIAIGVAVTLPFNPTAVAVSSVGAIAPDLIEFVLKPFGIRLEHRGKTHYLINPLLIICFSSIFDYQNLVFWFGIGYLTHLLADSLTIAGIPFSPLSKNKFNLFGGKFRTGDFIEYIIAFSLLAVSVFVFIFINKRMYL